MAGPTQGVLVNSLFRGPVDLMAVTIRMDGSAEALQRRKEWEVLLVVGSALVEDLYLEGVDPTLLAQLRGVLAGFAPLAKGSQEQVSLKDGESGRLYLGQLSGVIDRIPADQFARAVARTRQMMSLFGTSAATMVQLRDELKKRRGKERPIGYIGDAGLIHWTVDKARTPGKALLSILEHPRTKRILEALQPESSQLGNKEVVFQLDNGVTFKIRAIASHDTGLISTQPSKLFVEIGLNLNGISKDRREEVERRFTRLRMEIFRAFSSSEGLASLAAAEGITLRPGDGSITNRTGGLVLDIEHHLPTSFLRVDLRGEGKKDYRGWLSHFLGFFLRGGVWTFRP